MTDEFRQAVYDEWGDKCVVCGRSPAGWLNTTHGRRRQDKLSLHHVNGDDTDDRVENVIPVCQSCHVHIHRVDEPPYRKWHRQLPIEHRHAWNEHYHEYYEGPRLTRDEAQRRFGDESGVPESVKYLQHESDPTADSNKDASKTAKTETEPEPKEVKMGEQNETAPEESEQESHRKPFERVTIAYTPTESARRRIRFARQQSGSDWWRIVDEWTGCTWRPIGRESVSDIGLSIDRDDNRKPE